MKKLKLSLLLLIPVFAVAQLKPIGSWTDHLPYNSGTSIATDGNVIYSGTTTGLFTYDTRDNSIQKFSKVNILNDVEVRRIAYSREYQTLIIVYENANIDLIVNDRVINIPFIKLSNEKKTINEIKLQGNLAYFSMAYGVTVVDIVKKEIVDSYKFGPNGLDINVNSTELYGNRIYAATATGIYNANLNSNLLDFNSWSKLSFKNTSSHLKLFRESTRLGTIVDNGAKDSIYFFDGIQFDALTSPTGFEFKAFNQYNAGNYILNTSNRTYVLDESLSIINELIKNNPRVIGSTLTDQGRLFELNTSDPLREFSMSSSQPILLLRPNGPSSETMFDLDIENGQLWGVAGAHDATYNNRFQNTTIYNFDGSSWTNYNVFSEPSIKGTFDALSVTINPEDEKQVFFSTWAKGLLEYNARVPFKIYQDTNTTYRNLSQQIVPGLHIREALKASRWIGVGESDFDQEGNLWMTNTYQVNGLAVRKKNGSWRSFNLSQHYSNDETTLYDIVVDDNGYKWVVLPKLNSIIVYDDNGTIDDERDDRSILLTPEVGNGSIPGARGIKIEKDKDGLIWIGTSDGIAVHFNPGGVFDGDRDFDRIIFFDGENNEIVLQNSKVNEIAIDGFNRKWIGTESSGVILLSDDGKETILEFDEENSPLISNTINAISIDNLSGEVYFATAKGLVSYRSDAIAGKEDFNAISVFPNPVRPEYNGAIAISGLIDNSTVKITDINGTLINEFTSEGGQVLWDGNNFNGRRASTGVYLIFVSAEDADDDLKTEVGKIMFIN